MVHNHLSNFDSLHSPDDLITQLKSGIKYSIVESYTKRFIVVNTNNMMDDNDQLVKNITRFGNDFYGKIEDLKQQIINQKKEEHMKNTGEPYDYYELEKIKNEVYINLIKKHINEYEEGIQKFLKPGTGLKLFVHDKDYGEL